MRKSARKNVWLLMALSLVSHACRPVMPEPTRFWMVAWHICVGVRSKSGKGGNVLMMLALSSHASLQSGELASNSRSVRYGSLTIHLLCIGEDVRGQLARVCQNLEGPHS